MPPLPWMPGPGAPFAPPPLHATAPELLVFMSVAPVGAGAASQMALAQAPVLNFKLCSGSGS